MTRLHFWIVNGLAILVVILMLTQVILGLKAAQAQNRLILAQRYVQEGQVCEQRTRQLALRIYQVAQQTQDQALKDLLTRQDIHVNTAPAEGADAAATPNR